VRIVGGRHRGRRLLAPEGRDVRPTSDRTRESLFNILAHAPWGPDGRAVLEDALVLDAFCGTGALALEALSRGAARAALLDKSRASLELARRNAETLGEAANVLIVQGDAVKPPPARLKATLAFLDPPYSKDLAPAALTALARAGWLAPGALAIVELAASDPFPALPGVEALDERRYGETRVLFLRLDHTSKV